MLDSDPPDAENSTSYLPGASSSLTSVATSFPNRSKTFNETKPSSGIVNSIFVIGLNGLG